MRASGFIGLSVSSAFSSSFARPGSNGGAPFLAFLQVGGNQENLSMPLPSYTSYMLYAKYPQKVINPSNPSPFGHCYNGFVRSKIGGSNRSPDIT
jgi:hypothetical protein